MKIPEAAALSKATLGNIRQNVIIALLTVAGLLAGVLLGEVHMAGKMFIHELSVLMVILNSPTHGTDERGDGTTSPTYGMSLRIAAGTLWPASIWKRIRRRSFSLRAL